MSPLFPIFLALLTTATAAAGLSLERHKRQLLGALNLSTRPPLIRQPPLIPYSLTSHSSDIYGGVMEQITVETQTESWSCITPDTIVTDCFQYSLAQIEHQVVIKSASLILHSQATSNVTVMVFEVDELFGDERRVLDRFEIGDVGISRGVVQVKFDLTAQFLDWMRRSQTVKMLKIEILSSANYSSLRLSDAMLSAPHFEISVFRANEYSSSSSSISDSNCAGCCVVPFYVNFTEIGWNDWILSPPGFYANFCSGQCSSVDFDETYQFMKAALKDETLRMLPEPTCAPNYYGSVDFVVALGPRDIRRTRVHGMRALSCSCT
uniref:TGF_BETA_2 domain-containing protein n=1 Tax=Caenorhabditis japonica TaxID=281687 RepID=A0A8R1HZM6_CAEJA